VSSGSMTISTRGRCSRDRAASAAFLGTGPLERRVCIRLLFAPLSATAGWRLIPLAVLAWGEAPGGRATVSDRALQCSAAQVLSATFEQNLLSSLIFWLLAVSLFSLCPRNI
jgi:hypothetical protein